MPNINKKFILKESLNTIWLSISETAKIGGVNPKTVRRAIQDKKIKYKIVKERYQVELDSAINYLHSNLKLQNKVNQYGIGQYIRKWRTKD